MPSQADIRRTLRSGSRSEVGAAAGSVENGEPTPVKSGDRDERHPSTVSGWREAGVAFLWACALMAPMLGIGSAMMYSDWRRAEDARLAAIWEAQAYERLVAAPAAGVVPVPEAVHGRELFTGVCIACHGPQGTGVKGLGKNLVESDFVAARSDEELRQFLVTGRPDARPVGMPPKGGREDFTDDDLRHIVAYVRGLQDPRRMPELPAAVAAAPSEEQKTAALKAAGGNAELAGYIASGDTLFHSTCIACHGKGGVGIQGNGKALVNNPFIQSLDDDSLLAFVKQGRSPSDRASTTGIQMPPKGGNPALSDDDVLDIISYLRTLQPAKPVGAGAAK
ncbi:MAG: c-type cytochrome [Phycisphaerae bacterium]|nr:c-type cytochrome [Phycisphaerae bacterium]